MESKPDRVDKYVVVEAIGKGGFGHVFKAIHAETGETVAIKRIALDSIPKDQLSGIMMEIELLKRLQHRNIVKYITFIKTKDYLNIVLEYVENGSLANVVKKMGVFPESLVVLYTQQVLEGLVYLHEQGVIHRDIKGANILTNKDGVVKLADFGVATKLAEGEKNLSVVGTPYWMAPEIIEMSGVTPKSDIWSVGCTILELLTGAPPYFDLDPMPALFRIVQDDHPPIPSGVSPSGVNFLMECFQKNPDLRVDAATLLRHPWITRYSKLEKKPDVEEMKRTLQAFNQPRDRTSLPKDLLIAPAAVEDTSEPAAAIALAPIAPIVPAGTSAPLAPAMIVDKYRENDDDDGFDDIDFGDDDEFEKKASGLPTAPAPAAKPAPAAPAPTRQPSTKRAPSPKQAHRISRNLGQYADDDGDVVAEDDIDLNFKLHQRMKTTWDDKDVSQEFADFGDEEDALDSVVDIEEQGKINHARDIQHRQSQEILKLIASLQPDERVSVTLSACARLVEIFKESPAQKAHLVTHHGVIPIMEMLEVSNPEVLHAILQVVNQIIEDNVPLQENLCLVGIIPAILKFAGPDSSREIRTQAAHFVQQMCFSSTLTLQMFIACRGLPVLVGFLEPDYTVNKHLVIMAIKGIDQVFKLQSPTPRNDFCRLFAKSKLLPRLITAMLNVNKDQSAREYVDMIASIFLHFSQGDSSVKLHTAYPEVLKGMMDILDELQDVPATLLKLLKVIKFLTMDAMTLDPLQRAGAIPKLVGILNHKSGPHVTDMHNQVLNALFNLCKINRARQEQAARAGIVPHLKEIISANSPLKQLALPILCDLAHASKPARRELARHDAVQFYIDLLQQDYWGVTALEALAAWLVEDVRKTDKVERTLAKSANIRKLIQVFQAETNRYLNLLNAFLRIVSQSTIVNQQLGVAGFVPVLLERLQKDNNSSTRILTLKILLAIYEQHLHPKEMIATYRLFDVMEQLLQDKVLMVQDLARKLLTAFSTVEVM